MLGLGFLGVRLEAVRYPWYQASSLDENPAHVHQVVMHAVAADPSTFEDDDNWWSITFFEIGFSIARPMRGDDLLYQRVSRDKDGRWYLDHPGYEDEDEDEDEDE